jgi:hypothetical protein
MIGGRRAFAEGGYAARRRRRAAGRARSQAARHDAARAGDATRAGQSHAVTQIEKTEAESVEALAELPPVISVNPIRQSEARARPRCCGPTRERPRASSPRVSALRRGKTLALPIYDSWTWQMDAKIPSKT